jgi:hypothetical protein
LCHRRTVASAVSTFRSRAGLAAENLFLRKQLALYVEPKVRPRRATNPTRVALVLLSRVVALRDLLTTHEHLSLQMMR